MAKSPAGGGTASSKNVEMSFKFTRADKLTADLLIQIRPHIEFAIGKAFRYITARFKDVIVGNLISGGSGWKPLINGHAWKWINSPKGYAALGFSDAAQPLVLLGVLKHSFKVSSRLNTVRAGIVSNRTANIDVSLDFSLFDIQEIKSKTIHPHAGQGRLKPDFSWFSWVYEGKPKGERKQFVRTGPRKGARSSAIAGAMAGVMTSGGTWEVPPLYRIDLKNLVARNEPKITSTIKNVTTIIVKRELAK